MALNINFYNDIFDKENYCMELMQNKLLNIYYLNGKNGVKDFYIEKKDQLEKEYNISHSKIIKEFMESIDKIINEINVLTKSFKSGEQVDVNSLSNLFIVNQLNNNVYNNNLDMSDLQIKKQVLENLKQFYTNSLKNEEADYVYDEFPDEVTKTA